MTTVRKAPSYEARKSWNAIPFSEIQEPGCYFSNATGHLIRVPAEALQAGHSPTLEILGRENLVVTRLSEDPFLAINKARMIAADMDLAVDF